MVFESMEEGFSDACEAMAFPEATLQFLRSNQKTTNHFSGTNFKRRLKLVLEF